MSAKQRGNSKMIKEYKLIFNKTMAKYLQKKGNFCFKTIPNKKIEGYQIYLFDYTEKLKNDMENFNK
jgi:hypothetical protein